MTKDLGKLNVLLDLANSLDAICKRYYEATKFGYHNKTLSKLLSAYNDLHSQINFIKAQKP